MRGTEPFDLLFRDVEVDARIADVGIRRGHVAAIGNLHASNAARVVAGDGAALLPGLHDHHLHVMAAAAAADSVDCTHVVSLAELSKVLRDATPRHGWVRAVGYHETRAGPLDAATLDRALPDVPVRVHDHTGALWVLNSRALDLVATCLDNGGDVERDSTGRPNGRLWRYDRRLGDAIGRRAPDLKSFGTRLASLGITGVTDATPDLDASAITVLAEARSLGHLPQRLTLLGAPAGVELPPGIRQGPRKLHLRDHDLPDVQVLAATVRASHSLERPVALHCVTAESLLLALAALALAGPLPGDRIEHASVVPPGVSQHMSDLGVSVVTQPGFIRARGDDFLAHLGREEASWLYPWKSLTDAGISVSASSDAPHGPLSPWSVMDIAHTRTTSAGTVLVAGEGVDPSVSLDSYLSSSEAPGGPRRSVALGARADVVLLDGRRDEVLRRLPDNPVRLTVIGGRPVYDRHGVSRPESDTLP